LSTAGLRSRLEGSSRSHKFGHEAAADGLLIDRFDPHALGAAARP
jgi:hypothetical protein